MLYESASETIGALSFAPEEIEAGQALGLVIVYTAGPSGVEAGGCVRIQIPQACPPPQASSPMQPGYVYVRCAKEQPAISFTRCGHEKDEAYVTRFGHSVYLTFLHGKLEEGDTCTLFYGDSATGEACPVGRPMPTLAPYFSGQHEISCAVDVDGKRSAPYSGMFRTRERYALRVVPGAAVTCQAVRHEAGVTALSLDILGNPVQRLDRVPVDLPLNPSAPLGAYKVFFGDIHCHSRISDGFGSPAECYQFAQGYAGLDFCAVTDHSNEISPGEWEETMLAAQRYNQAGVFVTLLGYELSHPDAGDKNIYYPKESGPLLQDTDHATGRVIPIQEYVECWKRHGAMMAAHLHARHLLAFYDPALLRLLEIYSNWGCVECAEAKPSFIPALRNDFTGNYVQDALAAGFRTGFAGNSDDHMGRPGLSDWHRVERVYRGGLTAVYTKELRRETIFEALYARRCYATTGARMHLLLRINGAMPGEITPVPETLCCEVIAQGHGELMELEIIHCGEVVWNHKTNGAEAKERITKTFFLPGKPGWYYLRAAQTDHHRGWTSPIYVE